MPQAAIPRLVIRDTVRLLLQSWRQGHNFPLGLQADMLSLMT